jgi:cation/acetate symporter
MDERRTISQTRIDGRATFACAAYLIGVGLIFLLERIGAPDGLVRALAPILALGAVALIGALMRTTRIAAFFAADHAGAPRYGASAFAAIAASLIVCAAHGNNPPPHVLALAVGFALAGVAVGPLARSAGASSLRDVISARYNSRPLALVLGLAFIAIGVLIAAAGYDFAASAMANLLGLSRAGAIAAVGVSLALVVAPGGLAGLFWAATAAAGVIGLVLFLPIALRAAADAGTGAPLLGGGAEVAASLTRAFAPSVASPFELADVAIALGAALLPPLASSAFASITARDARRAGLFGTALAALFALAFALGATLWLTGDSAAAQSLRASALLIAALICAAAGAHTASRAVAAQSSYGYENVLASARLARSRGLALLTIAIGAASALSHAIRPAEALIDATALSLAFLGPPLALALSPRSRVAQATVAVATSIAAIAALTWLNGWPALLRQAPEFALTGAAAGFAVGWAASLFPGQPRSEAPPAGLFIEEPFDS